MRYLHPVQNKFALLIFIAALINSCSDSGKKPEPNYDYISVSIDAEYDYPSGGQPSLKITNSSEEVVFLDGKAPQVTIAGNRAYLTLSNVMFEKNDVIYVLDGGQEDSVVTKVQNSFNGQFAVDIENSLEISMFEDIQVVLVIDISTSLGTDRIKILEAAKSFCDDLKKRNPNARIGVELFSRSIFESPMSKDVNVSKNFIDTHAADTANATALYSAMAKGYDLIDLNDKRSSKAMIIFTDGICNAGDVQGFRVGDEFNVLSRVSNMRTQYGVRTFVIGLRGKSQNGPQEDLLREFADQGKGNLSMIDQAGQIDLVFNEFLKNISTIYTLVYNRNDDPVGKALNLKFELKLRKQK